MIVMMDEGGGVAAPKATSEGVGAGGVPERSHHPSVVRMSATTTAIVRIVGIAPVPEVAQEGADVRRRGAARRSGVMGR
ncbi:MAG: hypothetical protein QM753_02055 [Thermomicrobiales bacterium]